MKSLAILSAFVVIVGITAEAKAAAAYVTGMSYHDGAVWDWHADGWTLDLTACGAIRQMGWASYPDANFYDSAYGCSLNLGQYYPMFARDAAGTTCRVAFPVVREIVGLTGKLGEVDFIDYACGGNLMVDGYAFNGDGTPFPWQCTGWSVVLWGDQGDINAQSNYHYPHHLLAFTAPWITPLGAGTYTIQASKNGRCRYATIDVDGNFWNHIGNVEQGIVFSPPGNCLPPRSQQTVN
jgi:hypothetical protein